MRKRLPVNRGSPIDAKRDGKVMTIYDIAKEAGVSASSVSRVINNKPGVNPVTREKIMALLEKNNYIPNEAARGLVTSSSRLVGILVADIRHPHHIECAYTIAQELSGSGYTGLVLNAGEQIEEQMAALGQLEKRNVEAVVMIGSVFQSSEIREAVSTTLSDIPVFIMNGWMKVPNVYGVLSDDQAGLEMCVEFLAEKGATALGLIADRPTPSTSLKILGFEKGVRQYGLDSSIVRGVQVSLDSGEAALHQLLVQAPRVDGIICTQDILACGAVQALIRMGKKVPGDVRVIGVDNTVYAKICMPQLTSLDTMVKEAGMTIARKLVDCLEGKTVSRKTVLTPMMHEREST